MRRPTSSGRAFMGLAGLLATGLTTVMLTAGAGAATAAAAPTATTGATSRPTVLVDTLTNTKLNKVVATTTTSVGAPDKRGASAVTKTIVDGTGTTVKTQRYTVTGKVLSDSTKNAVDAVTSASRTGMRASDIGIIVSDGCCSDQGRHDLNFYVPNTATGGSATYHFATNICWGGGIPGLRWGSVHSCDFPAYTNYWPARLVDWINVNPDGLVKFKNEHQVSSVVGYFPWANMGYAPNTGWHDAETGGLTVCYLVTGCRNYDNLAEVWFHANGEFDWRTGR